MSLIIHIFRKVSAIHPSEKNIKDKTSVLVPINHMKKLITCLNYPEADEIKSIIGLPILISLLDVDISFQKSKQFS